MSKSYNTGKGRPPEHTQFKKGQSGNPAGRPRGIKNFKTEVRDELAKPVKVRENGRARTMRKSTLVVRRTIDDAITGKDRAADRVWKTAQQLDEEAAPSRSDDQNVEDTAIMNALTRRLLAKHNR